jgi:quercetin dioxygenase-like cupin family protein
MSEGKTAGFQDLDDLPVREPVPGFRGRFVHGESMTVAIWTIEAGSRLPEHTHPHEQISHVVEGAFELTLEDTCRVLDQGVVAVIPPHARHAGRALTACRIVDTFHPVRDDYR